MVNGILAQYSVYRRQRFNHEAANLAMESAQKYYPTIAQLWYCCVHNHVEFYMPTTMTYTLEMIDGCHFKQEAMPKALHDVVFHYFLYFKMIALMMHLE